MRPLALLAFLLAALPIRAQVLPSFGSDRAGTVGFQFLKLAHDPRTIALGQAVTTTATDVSALLGNPALAAQAGVFQIGGARTSYYDGTLFTTSFLGISYPVGTFAFGLSVQALDSGEMDVTDEFHQQGTGETFRFVDVAAGLTVAQRLTDLFSYGVTAKVDHEATAGLTTTTAALDLGIYYAIGATGARLGAAIRNFGVDAEPRGSLARTRLGEGEATEDAFETITLPTTFLLGLSYDAYAQGDHAVVVSTQLYRPNDNAESLGLGAEYTFRELLVLRGGYRLGVEEYVASFGGGVNVAALGARTRVDYGFTRQARLGNVHSIGLNLSF